MFIQTDPVKQDDTNAQSETQKRALDLELPMVADGSTGLFARYARLTGHGLFRVQDSAPEPHSFYHRQ